jgi:hypothetical protein
MENRFFRGHFRVVLTHILSAHATVFTDAKTDWKLKLVSCLESDTMNDFGGCNKIVAVNCEP